MRVTYIVSGDTELVLTSWLFKHLYVMGNCNNDSMKEAFFIIGLFTFLLTSCEKNRQNGDFKNLTSSTTSDTSIGIKNIPIQALDSLRIKKITEYYLILGNDSSFYNSTFYETRNGTVGVSLKRNHLQSKVTYRKQIEEFKKILTAASLDYNFDSLSEFSFGGRLISTGDLAINITNEYFLKFGEKANYEDYDTFEKFLKTSKLVRDIDSIFKPFRISVDNIHIEKLGLINKHDSLYNNRKIESETTIPNKVFDCWIRIKLKKITAHNTVFKKPVLRWQRQFHEYQ